jgi:hypothetical protein
MDMFPVLKTGAVIQYPAERELRFSTQVFEFIDGSEQRFRDYALGLRRWVVRLDLLDPGELQSLISFFDDAAAVTNFLFTDPWDGVVHPNCVVEGQELKTELLGEWMGRTELIIRENRT